eukprot:CAMPEP_0185028052 /NCGR_PEP_ID=MMETSP1103-20130426/13514_1 /TAXON_ID=36769 /ORGANISM="Paraphysomonas bandaiensis, Strain Caron Lab Isolate" /LENGTH=375 /DNA_ID=CAMNT_0027562297 /DNA_START=59 /DNA_END=1187 /DNA_ORIENTATION=+
MSWKSEDSRLSKRSSGSMHGIETQQESPELSNKRFISRNLSKQEMSCHEKEAHTGVALIIRSRILATSSDGYMTSSYCKEYSIFNLEDSSEIVEDPEHLLKDIIACLTRVTGWGQLPYDCMIIALIYIDHMREHTQGKFRLCHLNWRRTVLACLVLASKMWDDTSMINSEFALVYPDITLALLNSLEVESLKMLGFNALISSAEYTTCQTLVRNTAQEYSVRSAISKLEGLYQDQQLSSYEEEDDDEVWSVDGMDLVTSRHTETSLADSLSDTFGEGALTERILSPSDTPVIPFGGVTSTTVTHSLSGTTVSSVATSPSAPPVRRHGLRMHLFSSQEREEPVDLARSGGIIRKKPAAGRGRGKGASGEKPERLGL